MARPKLKVQFFTMVRRSIWKSRRFGSLPDDASRYLYLYLLTCPHQGGAGCFVANEAYILSDLAKVGSDWTPRTYAKCLAAIVQSGMILADDVTGEILIVDWWKDSGTTSPDQFTGAQRWCDAIESQKIRDAAQEAIEARREVVQAMRGLPSKPVQRHHSPGVSPQVLMQSLTNRLGGA
jgi:hypothetical protein